jgi:hypothetical protein
MWGFEQKKKLSLLFLVGEWLWHSVSALLSLHWMDWTYYKTSVLIHPFRVSREHKDCACDREYILMKPLAFTQPYTSFCSGCHPL